MKLLSFDNRQLASGAAAHQIATAAEAALADSSETMLVVSGGSSPVETFRQLAQKSLPWTRIRITLTDERLVDATDHRSNEKMVRENLMSGEAADARFVALDQIGPPAQFKASCTLVGMGEDGHFASLFPDLDELTSLLDTASPPNVCRVHTAASELDRLTMNLSLLLEADEIILLAFGDAKRAIIEAPDGYPVEALIKQTRVPVQIIWAP